MIRKTSYLAVLATFAFATAVHAQATTTETQRDVDQQQRIEQGLQSGQLTTHEAAKLESGEARVDRMQSKAMKNGLVSPAEQARIQKAQNAESAAIASQKHDAQTGHPGSASSKRMQADVQRNADQQARINQGVKSGSMTTTEAARAEHGQAHVDRREAAAGANGHVGAGEQAGIQHSENAQSARIYHKKHNGTAS